MMWKQKWSSTSLESVSIGDQLTDIHTRAQERGGLRFYTQSDEGVALA